LNKTPIGKAVKFYHIRAPEEGNIGNHGQRGYQKAPEERHVLAYTVVHMALLWSLKLGHRTLLPALRFSEASVN
jgi:hypothetical protein